MITRFDSTTIRLLKAEIVAALQPIATKYGISIDDTGKGSFSPQNYRFSLEAAVKNEQGETLTSEAAYFKQCAHLYGLLPDDLGKEFVNRRSVFTIIGAAAQSYRYPILCRNQNGKVYKFPAVTVCAALRQNAAKTVFSALKTLAPRNDTETQTITASDIGVLTPEQLDELIDGE
jgi:hypothetical protein